MPDPAVPAVLRGASGADPIAGLTLSGSTLYETTAMGGSANWSTIFSINTNGTGFQTLLNFNGDANGMLPYGDLTLSGSTLYGTTCSDDSGNGTIFAYDLPQPLPDPPQRPS